MVEFLQEDSREGTVVLFNSLAYAVFLPCVFILYWLLPHRARWPLLLVASYYFYMSWNAAYVILIAATTLVSYGCAMLLEKTDNPGKKKLYVAVALFISLGILFVFKYYNFTAGLLEEISKAIRLPRLEVLLPVGISFYTFQTLSYVIDVYRGTTKAEHNLGVYATFVSFFPQLVAGPIERSNNLLPQITGEKHFDYASATYGIRLILWGLYKKMVIADNLAVFVDRVFNNVRNYEGYSFVLAAFFFSVQIYCDFSGYSDIARGSAKLLGIDLMENFRSPYFSSSIREFWSRWHISLSTWFRDYVYIPLGGNRKGKLRTVLNNLITFLISGLWHGASVTYVVWGGIHGVLQVAENLTGIGGKSRKKSKLRKILGIPCVFVLVTLAWVFFRAKSLPDAIYILTHLFTGLEILHPGAYFYNGMNVIFMNWGLFFRDVVLYILPLAVYDWFSLKTDVPAWIGRRGSFVRYGFVTVLVAGILIFGYVGQSTFVYFQF
jgi:D-alanyl-lipoteichoic acid acyltransferase DltB (MBOAT superfamily)